MRSTLLKKKFDELAQEIIDDAETFTFNLKDLPDINDFRDDIRKNLNFTELFDNLDQKLNSCIYWFETQTIEDGNKLQNLLNQNREFLGSNFRTIPVKNNNLNSSVLYVGIRRGGYTKKHSLSNISGRITIHLGYYYKGSTQGLQLIHWAKNVDCKMNLKVVQFEDLPNEYLNTIEKILAFKLKPLCGKH